MNALILTLFISLVLAAFAILAFVFVVKQGDHEHNDRLSLLPLEDDAITASPPLSTSPPLPTSPPLVRSSRKHT